MAIVLPHSSASDWECWAEASARKPPFSSPPLMGLTEPGRSRAAGNPRGFLVGKYEGSNTLHLRWFVCYMYATVCLIMHLPPIYADLSVNISTINSLPLLLQSTIPPSLICQAMNPPTTISTLPPMEQRLAISQKTRPMA